MSVQADPIYDALTDDVDDAIRIAFEEYLRGCVKTYLERKDGKTPEVAELIRDDIFEYNEYIGQELMYGVDDLLDKFVYDGYCEFISSVVERYLINEEEDTA